MFGIEDGELFHREKLLKCITFRGRLEHMQRRTVFFIALYLLSRLLFLNPSGVFFDSQEYLHLFALADYFQAIVSGHFPPHVGYIIFFWPVYHLGELLHLPPALLIVLIQIGLSLVTLYCFFTVTAFLTNRRVAWIATAIASLTPLFWIVPETIMMENAYLSLFFLSLFLLVHYLGEKRPWQLVVSLTLFSLACLTEFLLIFWIPLLLWIVYCKQQRLFVTYAFSLIASVGIASLINLLFIAGVSGEPIPAVFHHLYFTKSGEFSALPFNLTGLLIAGRNTLIPLMRNNTSLLVFLSIGSLASFWGKEKKLFLLGLLWLLPAVYANQWWDSLLMGRHALVATFGLAFLTAVLLSKRSALVALLLAYLVIVTVPAVSLLRGPIPYLKEAEAVSALPRESLLVETHFAKPQVEETYRGTLVTVNDPLWSTDRIQEEIDQALKAKQPIFVTSGAISEPYGLYSGPYLHSLTLSYAKGFVMQSVLTQYTVVPYTVISRADNLVLYRIVAASPSAYPQVPSLWASPRRLDVADPLWLMWKWILKKK
jgi:hypothetical protein